MQPVIVNKMLPPRRNRYKEEEFILDGDLLLPILLQIVLIALNAVFACAEIAVISVNDAKLERSRRRISGEKPCRS